MTVDKMKTTSPKKPTVKGRHKYRGYGAFTEMCSLVADLFPAEKTIDGNSKRANAIYRAFDKVYTCGIEEAMMWDDAKRAREIRRVTRGTQERDV